MTKQELSKAIYVGLYADRDSLGEAYTYASAVANASDNPCAVMTAIHVLLNTLSKEINGLEA
jgi:hypothetical protein